jgi:phage baseplate assembly protein W
MSVEIAFPFALTASGSIAVTSDPGVQAQQHVTSLVSTQPGERVMQPAYGVSLNALVFAANDPAVVNVIQQDVTSALAQWEPSLSVLSVTPAAGQDPTQGQAMVNVDYQIAAQPGQPGAGIHTATVLVGGDVVIDS